MRIPNRLDDQNLYKHRPQGRRWYGRNSLAPSKSWRQMIRLVIVLALVVVVMRQALRTELYQVFFPAPLVVVATNSSPGPFNPLQPPPDPASLPEAALARIDAAPDKELIDTLAALLDDSGDPCPLVETLNLADTTSNRLGVLIAIEKQLINRANDGAVWRASDGPGLFAAMAIGQSRYAVRSPEEAIRSGVRPLLQQPAVHRGQTILAQGELVRLERVELTDERAQALGLDRQWNLWLRPSDGTDQPWLTIVAKLPKALEGLMTNPTLTEISKPRPAVQVIGQYLKRLPYQSAAGVELTPVVVGHVAAIQSNGNPLIRTSDTSPRPQAKPEMQFHNVSAILLATTFSGVAIAAFLMWTSLRQQRQSRSRRRHAALTTLPKAD